MQGYGVTHFLRARNHAEGLFDAFMVYALMIAIPGGLAFDAIPDVNVSAAKPRVLDGGWENGR